MIIGQTPCSVEAMCLIKLLASRASGEENIRMAKKYSTSNELMKDGDRGTLDPPGQRYEMLKGSGDSNFALDIEYR